MKQEVLLEARGLSYDYGEGFRLPPVSLTLRRGELLVIHGPSGAGKSTLIRLLCGLLPSPTGRLLYRGEPVDCGSPDRLAAFRRRIGIVEPRRPLPTGRSLRSLLDLALQARGLSSDARRRQCVRLLGQVGLSARAQADPATLSEGELRRAQLALALGGHPELLLLDEPLSNLPAEVRDQIFAELKSLRSRGTAILLSSHDTRLQEEGRLLRMEHGRLEEAR